jgi:hypothetical protein
MNTEPAILVVDSATKLDERHRGAVLIAGSHGGLYPAYLAARAEVRAVVLNDAGVGLDRAGIGCLGYFDALGRPAATVGHDSARIGDGDDMAARGVISHVNQAAAGLGCAPGQAAMDCARRMRAAPPAEGRPPAYQERRFRLLAEPGAPEVWGLDSVSLVGAEDAGRILVLGSHGALLAGRPETALHGDALAAVFHDAGVGADRAGIGRLPALDARGIAAATVAADTARIGDARSMWATGVVSHVNDAAARTAGRPGMSCRDFAMAVIAHLKKALP